MKNRPIFLIILVVVIVSGCVAKQNETIAYPSPNEKNSPDKMGPITTYREIGKNNDLPRNGYTLSIYGLVLTGNATTVLMTLTGINLHELVSAEAIQIIDSNNAIIPLITATSIGQRDGIEFCLLTFEARHPGVNSLRLQLATKTNPADASELIIAGLHGQIEEDRISSVYSFSITEPINQKDLRISLMWSLPPDFDKGAENTPPNTPSSSPEPGLLPTPTIVPSTELLPLAPGMFVQRNASFKVEDNKGTIQYLSVQFLSDGNVVLMDNGKVLQPKPIVISPTPTTEPYPSIPEMKATLHAPDKSYP